MPLVIPPLVQTETRYGTRYVFRDRDAFPYDEWVPSLVDIHSARNYGQQHDALTKAIIGASASRHGLGPASKSRISPVDLKHLRARFHFIEGDEQPKLTHLQVGHIAIGYLTASELTPNRSFAVLDGDEEGAAFHEIIPKAEKPLSEAGTSLGLISVSALMNDLADRYPGFDLPRKLEDALAAVNH
jgi:hypothetical protein